MNQVLREEKVQHHDDVAAIRLDGISNSYLMNANHDYRNRGSIVFIVSICEYEYFTYRYFFISNVYTSILP